MDSTLPRSVFPSRMQVLSGSILKLIAMATMFMDHFAAYLGAKLPFFRSELLTLGSRSYTGYRVFRDIGRIAFPIFVFLLLEGFHHTHSRLLYVRNLLIFALITEPVWNYGHTGTLFYQKQNVYFTLLLGFLGCWALEYFWDKRMIQLLCLLALFAASYLLKADYGWRGFIFILLMYMLRNDPVHQLIGGSCWLYYEWKACFAFIPINLYNGKRGFIKGKYFKYFFYLFYPLHILILALFKYNIL